MIAAVRLEDTLSQQSQSDPAIGLIGPVNPEAKDLVCKLAERGYQIIVYSALTNSMSGLSIAQMWLLDNEIPFNELWSSFGFPNVDLVIDFAALNPEQLLDLVTK